MFEPVIIGAAQLNDRDCVMDPLALMEAALRGADADAGGGWLGRLGWLGVVSQISFPNLGDCSGVLAERLGASPKVCFQTPYPMGDSPILLLNEAANRIGAGEIEVAAVVGAEALRTAARMPGAAADATRAVAAMGAGSYRGRYGLVAPTDIYPLYENACRAAWGQSLAEAQGESAEIWARFSEVAAGNEGAWLRTARTAGEIATPSAENRPVAFPYLKLMVANAAVNQGAGFLVTSRERALAAGVDEARLVYVGRGAAARETEEVLARDSYARSASMEVCLRRTLELNGVGVGDLDFAELYSCFPCVPKMARRVIGWPLARPASVFGGLTFGGGPIGNYMSHAVVSMVEKLRAGGARGLLFANGGYATRNHAIVLGRAPIPGAVFPQEYDFQGEAEAARGAVPVLDEGYVGAGTVETFTVLYGRDGAPAFGVVVVRTAGGGRTLARVPGEDADGLAFLTDGRVEPVGSAGAVVEGADGWRVWRR